MIDQKNRMIEKQLSIITTFHIPRKTKKKLDVESKVFFLTCSLIKTIETQGKKYIRLKNLRHGQRST